MDGLAFSLFITVLFGGFLSWFLHDCRATAYSLVLGVSTVLLVILLPIWQHGIAIIDYEENRALVLLYEEQMEDLDESFPLISELNPAAMVLVNQDTPIATAITTKSRLVEEVAEAKRDGYEARVYIRKIEAVFPWVSTYDFED